MRDTFAKLKNIYDHLQDDESRKLFDLRLGLSFGGKMADFIPAVAMMYSDWKSNELEEKRRDAKQTRNYINILKKAIEEQWSIGKIKAELSKAKYVPYKGRTKYYKMIEELLKEY